MKHDAAQTAEALKQPAPGPVFVQVGQPVQYLATERGAIKPQAALVTATAADSSGSSANLVVFEEGGQTWQFGVREGRHPGDFRRI